jgi:pilus assembly protein Flp/PilA
LKTLVSHFVTDEAGVTAIEYGLIAALIAVVIITSMTVVGTQLQAVYVAWSTAVDAAM